MKLIVLLLGFLTLPIAAAPAFADARADLSAAHKASRDDRRDEAVRLYTKAIDSRALSPADLASAYNGRATVYTEIDKHELAIADFTNGIEIAPQTHLFMLHGNRARTALSIKKYDLAIADFGKIIELQDDASAKYLAYVDRCDAYLQAGKKAEAAADCRKALELKPDYGKAKEMLRKAETP